MNVFLENSLIEQYKNNKNIGDHYAIDSCLVYQTVCSKYYFLESIL